MINSWVNEDVKDHLNKGHKLSSPPLKPENNLHGKAASQIIGKSEQNSLNALAK